MPTVPVPRQQVQTAPLPGVRLSPQAPDAAFGPPQPVPLQGAANALQEVAQREQDYADQMVVNAKERALSDLHSSLRTKALSMRGVDALGAQQMVQEEWRQGVSDLANGLLNDRQKAAFAAREQGYWASLHGAVEAHAASESIKQDEEDTTDLLQKGVSNAIQAPETAPQEIAIATARLKDFGRRNGWSATETEARIAGQVSTLHAAVLDHLTATGQDLAAEQYFRQHAGQMVGKDLLQAERLVGESSVRGASQRAADNIVKTATSLGSALEVAGQIQDPRVRDATEQRVRQHYADVRAAEQQETDAAFREASAIVEKTGSYDAVPLSLRVKLGPSENSALQRRAEQKRNPERTTNIELYSSLLNAAGLNEATRTWFKQANLLVYRNELKEDDFRHLQDLQFSLRSQELGAQASEAKAQAAKEKRDREQREKIEQAMRDMGIPITPKVPGAPIPQPSSGNVDLGAADPAPVRQGGPTMTVPQSWIDEAKRNPNYKRYLQHMGVQIQ